MNTNATKLFKCIAGNADAFLGVKSGATASCESGAIYRSFMTSAALEKKHKGGKHHDGKKKHEGCGKKKDDGAAHEKSHCQKKEKKQDKCGKKEKKDQCDKKH